MTASVYCITHNDSQASLVIEELKAAGYASDQISVLFDISRPVTNNLSADVVDQPMSIIDTGESDNESIDYEANEQAIGWVSGIGMVAVPRFGPMIAAGQIMQMISEKGWEGLSAVLMQLGIPEFAARRYEDRVTLGHVLLGVHTDDPAQVRLAYEIFAENNGEDIAKVRVNHPDRAACLSNTSWNTNWNRGNLDFWSE